MTKWLVRKKNTLRYTKYCSNNNDATFMKNDQKSQKKCYTCLQCKNNLIENIKKS